MTSKEKAIRGFTKAMKDADVMHMATYGVYTLNMAKYWELYIEACMQEVKDSHGKSK